MALKGYCNGSGIVSKVAQIIPSTCHNNNKPLVCVVSGLVGSGLWSRLVSSHLSFTTVTSGRQPYIWPTTTTPALVTHYSMDDVIWTGSR